MAERKAPFPNPPMCSPPPPPNSDGAHSRASFEPRGCDVEPKQRDLGAPPGSPSTPQGPQLPMSRGKPTHSRETPLLSKPIAQSFLPGLPLPRAQHPTPPTVPSPSRLRIGDIGRTRTSRLTRFCSLFCLLERGRLGLLYSWMERKSRLFQTTFAQTCSAQFLHLAIFHLFAVE